jgi:hypothetical protein
MENSPPPSNCPGCKAALIMRIAGPWCPRCRRWIVQSAVAVTYSDTDRAFINRWIVQPINP